MSAAGNFIIEIEPGNVAMSDGFDVAGALRDVADKVEPLHGQWSGEGSIIDDNGNIVGRWTFHDRNA